MAGYQYFIRGLKILAKPGIREFVVIPLLLNFVIFGALTWGLVSQITLLTEWLSSLLVSWLEWLLWLVWIIVGLLWLVIYGYFFSMISNSLAAPFYGLLAEKVQAFHCGDGSCDNLSQENFSALVARAFQREWQKIKYLAPRLIVLLLLTLLLSSIPVINLLATAVWFLWSAWSLCLQNIDYAADNNRFSFPDMRKKMVTQKGLCLSFGSSTVIASSIPLFNMLAVPAAVAGGTLLWLEQWNKNVKGS